MNHQPIKILLADDDSDDRLFFEMALNELKVATELKTVIDGEKLLNYLSKNTKQLPDVLFLDINMPRKSGPECLKELKANEKLKDIPVVIYSTALHGTIADNLYVNGAHYYLQKCDFPQLSISIQRILSLLTESLERPQRKKFVLSLQKA